MTQETKVGLFILVALAFILPAILFIGNIKLFQRSSTYFAEFGDVEALPPKAAVKIAGVEIGKVSKIKLVDGKARVRLDIDPSIDIHEDATARVGSTGVIGSRFIELDPGSDVRPVVAPGSTIQGLGSVSLNNMISKLGSLFDEDPQHGSAVDNFKAIMSNLRQVTDSLRAALAQRDKELTDIVLNIRTLTENTKNLTRDLAEIIDEKKEDVTVTLGNLRTASDKLDSILGKIDRGEGTIGTLVSDRETEKEVKEAISSIKETASSAKKLLGRLTLVKTYWNYRYRYDYRDNDGRSDVGITFVPRKGKFYSIGVENAGEPISNEKNLVFERKNRITAVMGADWGPFTGYVGAIRSDGGFGFNFRPFWLSREWGQRVQLEFQAADFQRDRMVQGQRLDRAWVAAGGRVAILRWLWIGARVEDILERSAFMGHVNVIFRDEDLAYILGLASFAR